MKKYGSGNKVYYNSFIYVNLYTNDSKYPKYKEMVYMRIFYQSSLLNKTTINIILHYYYNKSVYYNKNYKNCF